MKIKCIEKKAFPTKSEVIRVAKNRYLKHGQNLGFYECSVCLDFHLTSKKRNLSHLHKKWKKEGLKKNHFYLKRKVEKQYREFLKIEERMLKRQKHGLPLWEWNEVIAQERKENTLSLNKQRDLLSKLSPEVSPGNSK